MKIFVHKTSGWIKDGCVREFESLEQCLETLEHETGEREYVVENWKDSWVEGSTPEADWVVEIYDGLRE